MMSEGSSLGSGACQSATLVAFVAAVRSFHPTAARGWTSVGTTTTRSGSRLGASNSVSDLGSLTGGGGAGCHGSDGVIVMDGSAGAAGVSARNVSSNDAALSAGTATGHAPKRSASVTAARSADRSTGPSSGSASVDAGPVRAEPMSVTRRLAPSTESPTAAGAPRSDTVATGGVAIACGATSGTDAGLASVAGSGSGTTTTTGTLTAAVSHTPTNASHATDEAP